MPGYIITKIPVKSLYTFMFGFGQPYTYAYVTVLRRVCVWILHTIHIRNYSKVAHKYEALL